MLRGSLELFHICFSKHMRVYVAYVFDVLRKYLKSCTSVYVNQSLWVMKVMRMCDGMPCNDVKNAISEIWSLNFRGGRVWHVSSSLDKLGNYAVRTLSCIELMYLMHITEFVETMLTPRTYALHVMSKCLKHLQYLGHYLWMRRHT